MKYCDCACHIHNPFWLLPVILKLASTGLPDTWWKSMWVGWGTEIRISSDWKAGMQGHVNIRESVWKGYEYLDLSKILSTPPLLTSFVVSRHEETELHLFNCFIHGTTSVFLKWKSVKGEGVLPNFFLVLQYVCSCNLSFNKTKTKRLFLLCDVAIESLSLKDIYAWTRNPE